MDKLLTVLEEALEAGGYSFDTVVDDDTEERPLNERFVTDSQRPESGPHFIVTVEYA